MAYKLKKLVDEGFDFNSLYPEGVEDAKSATMLNYSLQEIVDFLKVQTNDFTEDSVVAKDLDNAIFRIYEKHIGETQPEKADEVESTPTPPAEKKPITKESIDKQIKALKYLAEKKNNESAKKQIKALTILLKRFK